MFKVLATFIVKHRRKIGIIFLILTIISVLLIPKVTINYDLSEYVPDDKTAKRGLNIVEEQFGMQGVARIMLNDVTLVQAKEYKDRIAAVDGVDTVLWLDDVTDVYQPIEFISEDVLKDYYKDGSAILEVMFEEDDYSLKTDDAIDAINEILPENSQIIGSAVDTKSVHETLSGEITVIMAILVPVVIGILLLTTTSWFSPVLFLMVIGASILLNMGTCVMFKNVSFITFSIVAALQLAVSMDYSVFLLHQFETEIEKESDPEKAMIDAIKHSGVSICSSALTTVAGFVALVLMRFSIGRDMGLVFAKGIVFSLICVLFLMPYLILKFYPLIKKTSHRMLLPDFKSVAKYAEKVSYLIIVLVLIVVIPSYIAQQQNNFLYGASSFGGGEGTQVFEDEKLIVAKFGRSTPVILLVPTGDYVSEKALAEEIEDMAEVKKVQSLANLVPEGVPDAFIPVDTYKKFRTEDYSRIVIYTRTSSESELAFKTVEKIEELASKYYGENYEIAGVVPITLDIKETVNEDYMKVNLFSIGAVMVILLFTFKSFLLPIILILVIESGIMINMAIPYYTGYSMMFLGYLIVSSIQLGATIDYAILVTNNYQFFRGKMDKKEASLEAVRRSIPAILTSGGILTCAAYLLKYKSSTTAVSEMGDLIGRGALLSMFLVTFFLPHLLTLFDKIISKKIIKNKTSQ